MVRDEHDGIPLGIFCRQSLAGYLDPDEIFEVTRQGFDFLPRGVRDQVPVREVRPALRARVQGRRDGERGRVTFLEDYVFRSRVTDFSREARGETILHEMAHMWFGDLVTMRWWDDLWLNESFATWAGTSAQAEATRWTHAWTTFASCYKAWAYQQDQLPSTHPIAADIPDIHAVEVNFDGITYAKGASVLKQLVAYVGPGELPGRACGSTSARTRGATRPWPTCSAALEETSGRDLAAWSREWLRDRRGEHAAAGVYGRRGRPVHLVRGGAGGRGPSHPVLRSHRIAIGLYDRTDGGLIRRRRRSRPTWRAPRTVVAELAGQRRPDLVLVNDDDLTYAKIRLDEPFAAHAGRLDRRVHRLAARRAVLGGGVGHVPGRRRWRPATTSGWCWRGGPR